MSQLELSRPPMPGEALGDGPGLLPRTDLIAQLHYQAIDCWMLDHQRGERWELGRRTASEHDDAHRGSGVRQSRVTEVTQHSLREQRMRRRGADEVGITDRSVAEVRRHLAAAIRGMKPTCRRLQSDKRVALNAAPCDMSGRREVEVLDQAHEITLKV